MKQNSRQFTFNSEIEQIIIHIHTTLKFKIFQIASAGHFEPCMCKIHNPIDNNAQNLFEEVESDDDFVHLKLESSSYFSGVVAL